MSDIIKLLPESIANQIAAGEVIQRPASVVKELLENAIDAGATSITLVIKNSGKTLIQVIDNGKGMSETDARMSFERHATSKIREANDLFSLTTMGFRGEALASIASIAEVELKTREAQAEMATLIRIKSSTIEEQSYCQSEPGTSIAVKNLFFNIPARRKFLKSDSVELKYILEEFSRVALAHSDLKFRVVHNDNELYALNPGSVKKRVISLFRKTYEEKLIRVEEDTDVIKISGLIGNPEIAKKQKGEQFIFVNNRFIKSNYLNHAIQNAYDVLISDQQYPFYVLFLEIDPSKIDINVHPTKQEIKFDDERLIYNYLKVSIKHALGRYSLAPTLDFENQDSNFRTINPNRMTQNESSGFSSTLASRTRSAPVMRNWQSLYKGTETMDLESDESNEDDLTLPSAASGDLLSTLYTIETETKVPFQIHNQYIIVQVKSGFMLIDQNLAHQRILFEKYLRNLNKSEELIQKQLFPITIQVSKDKVDIFQELSTDLKGLGFEIQSFGGETFVIHGIPSGFDDKNLQGVMDTMIDQYINNLSLNLPKKDSLARSMAQSAAIKRGQSMTQEELTTIIDELFACKMPYTCPKGRKTFITYELDQLQKQFT